jgi:hypothetical protein
VTSKASNKKAEMPGVAHVQQGLKDPDIAIRQSEKPVRVVPGLKNLEEFFKADLKK